jgi:hypothetical protein
MTSPIAEIHYHAASQFQGMNYAQIKALLNDAMQVHIADGAAIRAAEARLQELTRAQIYTPDGEEE